VIGSFLPEKPQLLIVVSAMGKTTNALERLAHAAFHKENDKIEDELSKLKRYHLDITENLFPEKDAEIFRILDKSFYELQIALNRKEFPYDKFYDQIVSWGEIISSQIVAEFLHKTHGNCLWVDAREYIQTDSTWREGKIEWEWSSKLIKSELKPLMSEYFILTQGFIGGAMGRKTTTLGREGSDFSAAVFANCLDADSLTIWKDVPGILNADPKRIADAKLFDKIPYKDAAEMTYFGASVIHPKTIKPLANKKIPLYVKSFVNPKNPGTVIGDFDMQINIPAFIFKTNQVLLTVEPKNLASVNEEYFLKFATEMSRLNLKINLIQSSAVSIRVCTDDYPERILHLQEIFDGELEIGTKRGLELLTIKNYNADVIENFSNLGNAVLEQRTQKDFQVILSK
jgi:aspartate kinase